MNCPNCHKEIKEEETIYCPQCGLNLKEDLIIDEVDEDEERLKRIRVMKKLCGANQEELLSRGIPREKIEVIKEDLRLEFLEGNLKELPLLLKECVFQDYSRRFAEDTPKKGIVCGLLRKEKQCIKEICPFYQTWKRA